MAAVEFFRGLSGLGGRFPSTRSEERYGASFPTRRGVRSSGRTRSKAICKSSRLDSGDDGLEPRQIPRRARWQGGDTDDRESAGPDVSRPRAGQGGSVVVKDWVRSRQGPGRRRTPRERLLAETERARQIRFDQPTVRPVIE